MPSIKTEHMPHFRLGLRHGIPIALGYFFVSFTLGIAASNIGLSAFQSALMSFSMHASAGEFAALSIMAAGGSYAEMALTETVVNLRYLLMSCSLSQKLPARVGIGRRMLLAFGITDEIFALSATFPGSLDPAYSYGLFCVSSPGWVVGTFLGAAVGNILPVSVTSVMSIALYGMFISIIIPPAKHNPFLGFLVLFSMLASTAFAYLPLLRECSSGTRIMILTPVISAVAAIIRPVKEETEEHHDA